MSLRAVWNGKTCLDSHKIIRSSSLIIAQCIPSPGQTCDREMFLHITTLLDVKLMQRMDDKRICVREFYPR